MHAGEGAVRGGEVALGALGPEGVEAGLEERPVEHLEPALRGVPPQRAALVRERGDDVLDPLRRQRGLVCGAAAFEVCIGGRALRKGAEDLRGDILRATESPVSARGGSVASMRSVDLAGWRVCSMCPDT